MLPQRFFSLVPLASTVRIRQAGGNDALALLLTVTTNLLGVLTVPFFVKGVVRADGASIDGVDLLIKLVSLRTDTSSDASTRYHCAACRSLWNRVFGSCLQRFLRRSYARVEATHTAFGLVGFCRPSFCIFLGCPQVGVWHGSLSVCEYVSSVSSPREVVVLDATITWCIGTCHPDSSAIMQ